MGKRMATATAVTARNAYATRRLVRSRECCLPGRWAARCSIAAMGGLRDLGPVSDDAGGVRGSRLVPSGHRPRAPHGSSCALPRVARGDPLSPRPDAAPPPREAPRTTPAGVAPGGRGEARWEVSLPVVTGHSTEHRRLWAPPRADVWLAVALVVAQVGVAVAEPAGPPYRPVDALALVLAAVWGLALLWRSAAPLAALVLTSLVVVVNAAAGFDNGFLALPTWIALFTCFALGGGRVRTAALTIGVLAVAGYALLDRGNPMTALPNIALTTVFAAVAGELSSRRARAAAAEARRADENDRRALVAERLLLQERTRLARELHDSLGHTVNVMVLQARVGRRVFAENPAFAHEALASIETVGRGALEELDRLLKVLQPDEGDRHAVPFAPTLGDLEGLAERIRATGRQVDLRMDGVAVPDSCARALYRIVQEALTNAGRHSSAGRIRVEVSRDGDRVVADVVNEGARFDEPVPGRGLVNMRERARLEGGTLEAGPVEGGFRVRAVLPAAAAVTA